MIELAQLEKLLTLDEGRRRMPYHDSRGILTIGIGHNLDANGVPDSVIDQLFALDIAQAEDTLTMLFPNWKQLDDVRQAVLYDLAFNLAHRLTAFHAFQNAVNGFNWDAAGDALVASEWYTQVGQRGPRLVGMIRTGQWPAALR